MRHKAALVLVTHMAQQSALQVEDLGALVATEPLLTASGHGTGVDILSVAQSLQPGIALTQLGLGSRTWDRILPARRFLPLVAG